MNKTKLTLNEAVDKVINHSKEPTLLKTINEEIFKLWSSTASKSAISNIRMHLRYKHHGKTIAYLDKHTIVPLKVAMQDIRFRVPVSRMEAENGILFLHPYFILFLQHKKNIKRIKILDISGNGVPSNLVKVLNAKRAAEQYEDDYLPAFKLKEWFNENNIKRHDSIIVTIKDWQQPIFCFEAESEKSRKKHYVEIQQYNKELADAIFGGLESAHEEHVSTQIAVLDAYSRLSKAHDYPGDHWIDIIDKDPRMIVCDTFIAYRDSMEGDLFSNNQSSPARKTISKADAKKEYSFAVTLIRGTEKTRHITLSGDCSMAEFDYALRELFDHDDMDHMGGFWLRQKRAHGNKFREIEIATINPLGEGDNADLTIAELGLQPGDELKYVYDFGDWIEHRIVFLKRVN